MSNPFAFFGLEPSLFVDVKSLRKQYLEIQRGSHPDLVSDDQTAIEQSEQANANYKLLLNPLSRVKSYLEIVSANAAIPNSLPQDFLMEMMELSDSIEEMDRQNTAAMALVEGELMNYERALEMEFEQFQNLSKPDLKALGEWYQKSKYIGRLRKNFDGIVEI